MIEEHLAVNADIGTNQGCGIVSDRSPVLVIMRRGGRKGALLLGAWLI